MPVHGGFVTNINQYLEAIARAGEDVDQVVSEVLEEAREPAGGLMYSFLRRSSETWTGAMAKAIVISPVQREGNYIFFELSNNDPGAMSKEFGKPRTPAEPFLRPTMDFYRKKEIKRLMKKVLERFGLDT